MIKRYAVKLGIRKKVNPHLWRHSSISRMYEKGMSEAEIKRISGHSKQSNALRTYINPSAESVITKSQDALRLNKDEQVKTEPVKAEPEPQPTPQKPQPKPEPQPETPPQDKDTLIAQLVEEVKKLRRDLDNQTKGYV